MGRYPHDIKGPKSWSDFKSSYPISRFIISEKLHSPFVNGVWTVQYSQLGSLNSMMMDTVTDVPPDKSFFNGCFFYGCNYHSLILIRTHWFLTMTTTKLILINQTQHHKKKFPDSPSQCKGLRSSLMNGKPGLLSLSETSVCLCTGTHNLGLLALKNQQSRHGHSHGHGLRDYIKEGSLCSRNP